MCETNAVWTAQRCEPVYDEELKHGWNGDLSLRFFHVQNTTWSTLTCVYFQDCSWDLKQGVLRCGEVQGCTEASSFHSLFLTFVFVTCRKAYLNQEECRVPWRVILCLASFSDLFVWQDLEMKGWAVEMEHGLDLLCVKTVMRLLLLWYGGVQIQWNWIEHSSMSLYNK